MSSNGDHSTSTLQTPPAALDVGFASVGGQRRNGESSSKAESRSSEKRSSGSSRSNRSDGQVEQHEGSRDIPHQRISSRVPNGSIGHRTRNSGGFMLDSIFTNGSPKGPNSNGKRKAQDGHLHIDKRRVAQNRLSVDSAQRSSPLSRHVSNALRDEDEGPEQPSSRPQSMDPTQLVQMALNLSESRKRHISGTVQAPLPLSQRTASGPRISSYGTVKTNSSGRKRVIQLSADSSRRSRASDRSGMDEVDQSNDEIEAQDPDDNVLYTFSPATLSRAEKARKYFELASQHRRLLQSLPPLKPDSSAPGNFTFETTSRPGSAYPQITRTLSSTADQHVLGRSYNPIQSLRNRRVRIREKRPFPVPPDSWADLEKVNGWIDDVESATNDPYYRMDGDRVQLPLLDEVDGTGDARKNEPSLRHRRTDTVGSVIIRPENSWTIEPTELLADTYWTEKGDNKAYIENRQGNTIFPKPDRRSIDTPRISVEMHRGREDAPEDGNENDAEELRMASRTRRLIMPLKGHDKRKHRRLISRSPSVSSSSSNERRPSASIAKKFGPGEENIGPLENYMQELIAKDEQGELSSPEMASPDHWDSKHMPYPRAIRETKQHESPTKANGRSSLEVPRIGHVRSKSADGRFGSFDHGRSSTESPGSAPLSPIASQTSTLADTVKSESLNSRRSLDIQRRGALKLPDSRPHSNERNNIAQVDFADGAGAALATIPSVASRASEESARPSRFLRHRTDESYANSLQQVDTGSSIGMSASIKDSGSTVGRILKGGRDRIGTLVRGDGPRFSDRFKNRDRLDAGGVSDVSRGASDIEDAEMDADAVGHLKRRTTDSPLDSSRDVSPRASLDRARPKPKYHLSNLPSFTSSARDKRTQFDSPASTNSDPIARQSRAQQEAGKSERFERLAPPRITLPHNSSNPELAVDPTDSFERKRKGYGELKNKLDSYAFGPPALPFAGLGSTPRQRHWSIYDQIQPQHVTSDKITHRDIARVKALLLCSAIKAREIQRRADRPREAHAMVFPTSVLEKASETAGQTMEGVPLKEEPVVAARMLSDHLSSSFSDFEQALASFQNGKAKELNSQLDELRQRASEHLTKLVHETSDEADAFTVELTTRQPQHIRQVDGAVDTMLNRRRRQFRLLKSTGFKMLEWLVLSIMWWIWFIVVVFNIGKKSVVVLLRFLRWLVVF